MTKSHLPVTTTMYSVHKVTGAIVIHHLPWGRGNPQLEHYEAKGFTFERPVSDKEIIAATKFLDDAPGPKETERLKCPACGKLVKPKGLKAHKRFCKKVKV